MGKNWQQCNKKNCVRIFNEKSVTKILWYKYLTKNVKNERKDGDKNNVMTKSAMKNKKCDKIYVTKIKKKCDRNKFGTNNWSPYKVWPKIIETKKLWKKYDEKCDKKRKKKCY